MLRAATLVYAIVIALIIAIISSSLLLLGYYSRRSIDISFNNEKQQRNCNSALNYYLTNSELWTRQNKIAIDLFDELTDSVDIEKKEWGFLDIIKCTAYNKNCLASRSFLVADKPDKESLALYLADMDKPLAISGNTNIRGLCLLPSQGVKRTFIAGQGNSDMELIHGKVMKSTATLPTLSENALSNSTINSHDSIVNIESIEAHKNCNRSFLNETIILQAPGDLDLDNYELNGNIIIRSEHQILIRRSSSLRDVIIIAPRVRIESGFEGTLQILATDSIDVEPECVLNYPSVLATLPSSDHLNQGRLIIQAHNKIYGAVVNLNTQNGQNKTANTFIGEGTNILGTIYSNDLLEFRGNVVGSIYTEAFILHTGSAIYENHLLDASIDGSSLPEYFVGLFPKLFRSRKGLIKQLL